MNKHKNRGPKLLKVAPQNRKEITPDHMPVSVATDMLCTSPRLTGKDRRIYQAARDKTYASTLEPKAAQERLNSKFQKSTAAQLQKWLRRSVDNRKLIQAAYVRAQTEHNRLSEFPTTKDSAQIQITGKLLFLEKSLTALALKAAQVDMFRDSLEDEIQRRKDFITALRKVHQEELANRLQAALV
jgi:hypothetical protein